MVIEALKEPFFQAPLCQGYVNHQEGYPPHLILLIPFGKWSRNLVRVFGLDGTSLHAYESRALAFHNCGVQQEITDNKRRTQGGGMSVC